MSITSLSVAEILALLSTGYVSGLSIGAGFVLSAIFQLYVKGKEKQRSVIWTAVMVVTMIFSTLAPIFMIAVLVFGDEPERVGFWLRMLVFLVGIAAGACFSYASAHLVNKAARKVG